MLKFIRNDFAGVYFALRQLTNDRIPKWLAIMYYVVFGLIVLPFAPFVWIAYKIWMWKISNDIKRLE